MKVGDKHIFFNGNKSKAQGCGYTKACDLRLKKDSGYIIKNKGKKLKSSVRQVRFILSTCLTIMTIVVHSGALRQVHQKKGINTTKKMMNSDANKMTTRCTMS